MYKEVGSGARGGDDRNAISPHPRDYALVEIANPERKWNTKMCSDAVNLMTASEENHRVAV